MVLNLIRKLDKNPANFGNETGLKDSKLLSLQGMGDKKFQNSRFDANWNILNLQK
jgi:hypothetical protein